MSIDCLTRIFDRRHTFKKAAMTSFHTGKGCHLLSACGVRSTPAASAAATSPASCPLAILCTVLDPQTFSSVQLLNVRFTQSYNKNYDGCADA